MEGIAVHDDMLYVAESGRDRVHAFNTSIVRSEPDPFAHGQPTLGRPAAPPTPAVRTWPRQDFQTYDEGGHDREGEENAFYCAAARACKPRFSLGGFNRPSGLALDGPR